ncbi:MAG: LamG-like jellyroll fold domain-containing protein [Candidatus Paceibacterota bacterium]|jgi:hypothetical protein
MPKFKRTLLYTLFSLGILTVVVIAGSLTPSATPLPTSYTLNDLYNILTAGTEATAGNHTLSTTTEATATTSHSIGEIYALLANLINPNNIKSGTTYLGITSGDAVPTTVSASSSSLYPTTDQGTATGYSLADIYNLAVSPYTRVLSSSHTLTTSNAVNATMYSITEIYDALVAFKATLNAANINSGTTYMGVAGTYIDPYTDPALVGWWKLNGDSTDSSGNGNDGTWTGTYTNGFNGAQAGSFDGTSVFDSSQVSLSSANSHSVSFWFNKSSLSVANTNLLGFYNPASSGSLQSGISYTGSTLQAVICKVWVSCSAISTHPNMSDNTWHLISVNYRDNQHMDVYLDGVFIETVNQTVATTYTGVIHFGVAGNPGSFSGYLTGSMADIAIWSRALTADEILDIYTRGFKPVGGSCSANNQCQSENCSGSVCAAALVPLGGVCTQTSDCQSNLYCGGSADYVCTDGAIGAYCFNNASCASNFCDSGTSQCAVSP